MFGRYGRVVGIYGALSCSTGRLIPAHSDAAKLIGRRSWPKLDPGTGVLRSITNSPIGCGVAQICTPIQRP